VVKSESVITYRYVLSKMLKVLWRTW